MPSGTQFRPTHENAFNSDAQRINIQSVQAMIEPGETKNIDLQLADDHLLQGVEKLLVYDGHKDDKITLQIIHPVTGLVVPSTDDPLFGQFVTNYFIDPTVPDQKISIPRYTAKILAGLIIRCKYQAANAGTQRDVRINWLLHKVLI